MTAKILLPIPLENELIYSVIARYKIRTGITSPKVLLDEVFNNRKVISTIDLPSFISCIEGHLPASETLTSEALIYKHTLFPLYAPFVDDVTKHKALNLMRNKTKGAVHLSLGVAASIVKASVRLRLCRQCVKRQITMHGEAYWKREWLLPDLPNCAIHGRLTHINFDHQRFRHEYVACPSHYQSDSPKSERMPKNSVCILNLAKDLLDLPPMRTPTFEQWTLFYQKLARDNVCTKGKNINHNSIMQKIDFSNFPSCLSMNADKENYWLKAIFRKHRKSFSYLQHLIVWNAFLPELGVRQILDIACKVKPVANTDLGTCQATVNYDERSLKRRLWTQLIENSGAKTARYSLNGQACYAWLYRHDKQWLMIINRRYRVGSKIVNKRVDWGVRDRVLSRSLLAFINSLDTHIIGPRRSKQFLLSQLPNWRSISKNLNHLRRLRHLLNTYQETIQEYQIRRITLACVVLLDEHRVIAD